MRDSNSTTSGAKLARIGRPKLRALGAVAVLGASWLALNALGPRFVSASLPAPARSEVGQVPGFHHATQSGEDVVRYLSDPSREFVLEVVNESVFRTLRHSDGRRQQPYENLLLWIGGKVYAPLAFTQSPSKIVRGGEALCSQAALVLNSIARLHGIKTRFVGLNGHVVSEILTAQGWRVADPDFGVVYPVGIRELEGAGGAELAERALRRRGYEPALIRAYVGFFQTTGDNVVTSVDQPLSPRLAKAEAFGDWLNWLVPLAMVATGAMGLFGACAARRLST